MISSNTAFLTSDDDDMKNLHHHRACSAPAIRRVAACAVLCRRHMPAAIPRLAIVSTACGFGALALGSGERAGERSDREQLAAQRDALFETMRTELGLSDRQLADVREIFGGSAVLGQGNPVISVHPMTREECRGIRAASPFAPADSARCGFPNMVPIYDPAVGETEADARVCIDQYEFPDIPCEYPVVHVTAREATLLCEAVGKRVCDAHEWEGACAGAVHEPDREYAWGRSRGEMQRLHNESREMVWAYGPTKDHAKCATGSFKSPTLPRRGLRALRIEHVPGGRVSRLREPLRRIRPARQRRRAHEPAVASRGAGEPWWPGLD